MKARRGVFFRRILGFTGALQDRLKLEEALLRDTGIAWGSSLHRSNQREMGYPILSRRRLLLMTLLGTNTKVKE